MHRYAFSGGQFDVLGRLAVDGGGDIQVAAMSLKAGETSGEYGNEHPNSMQVLIVVSGSGRARVEGRDIPLRSGDVLVVDKGEKHQIIAGEKEDLRTQNFYIPPAYDANGEPLKQD